MRIVSLLPSATEVICLIGAADDLVGRSHECDHPRAIRDRPVLTDQNVQFTSSAGVDEAVSTALDAGNSLYTLDVEKMQELRPDVIVTQDLCEVCSIDLDTVRRAASEMNPPPRVLSLNPDSFEAVLDDILAVGEALGRREQAETALVMLRERFFSAADHVNPYADPVNVAFLEWTDPIYVGGHWTPQLIERAGGSHPLNPTRPMENAGAGAGAQGAHRLAGKSRRVSEAELVESSPEAIVVCPCGLDLDQTRKECAKLAERPWWPSLPAVQNGRVAIVDGNQMFNRPGPRLVDAYEWLVGWLNGLPELIPRGFPWEEWRG